MFGKSRNKKSNKPAVRIDTLIGQKTHIKGDIEFSGGLRVDGNITGSVNAINDIDSVLTLSEQGSILGEIRVPNMIINGTINGNVYAVGHVELADKAKVKGNVYYRLLEMTVGSEVNGQLIRMSADNDGTLNLDHDAIEETKAFQLERKAKS
jgi:cytoskeletal protein CcmA (bactofilin family)